jgi:WhiB family transcriptional regulator, redox-sensing transcriptional regulator
MSRSNSFFGNGADFTEYPDFSDAERGKPACEGEDVEIFFVEPSEPDYRRATTEAKEFCKRCPYVAECFEWALKNNEMGVWGGTTERERASMKRKGVRPWNI